MHRCVHRLAALSRRRLCASLLAALTIGATTPPLAAQERVQRQFPADALRGVLQITQPPDALLDGQPVRLAPGARVRGPDNLLVMSGAVAGQTLVVHYTVDTLGLLKDVWLLRADEVRQFWPRTPAEAARHVLDPAAQTWSRRP
jgi:hypothetical protein